MSRTLALALSSGVVFFGALTLGAEGGTATAVVVVCIALAAGVLGYELAQWGRRSD